MQVQGKAIVDVKMGKLASNIRRIDKFTISSGLSLVSILTRADNIVIYRNNKNYGHHSLRKE